MIPQNVEVAFQNILTAELFTNFDLQHVKANRRSNQRPNPVEPAC